MARGKKKMGPKVPAKVPPVGNKGAARGKMPMVATPGPMTGPPGSMSAKKNTQAMTKPRSTVRRGKKKRGMM